MKSLFRSKMSTEEYSIKDSTKSVGQLYPVLLSKEGLVIDGHHRLEDEPEWRTETLEHIDTEEKIILARAISNWHRRQIPRVDKEEWVNALARIYLAEGLKVSSPRPDGSGAPLNEIANRIIETMSISRSSVMNYLHPKYKQKARVSRPPGPRVPASQAISRMTRHSSHSGDLVSRHREELLHDEGFQEEVLQEVGKRVGRPSLAMDVVDVVASRKRSDLAVNMDPLVLQDMEEQNFRNVVTFNRDELLSVMAGGSAIKCFTQGVRQVLREDGVLSKVPGRPEYVVSLRAREILAEEGHEAEALAMEVHAEEVPEEEGLAIEGTDEEPPSIEAQASGSGSMEEPTDEELLADHLRAYPLCICKECPHVADCMGMK